MSDHLPPGGEPEYLDYGGGAPLPPADAEEGGPEPGRRRHRAWWIAGGVVALAGIGAGAWAALSFFQQGAQPAEALPASTVAYLSVDLDPSGGQKIDAFRTLNKFPAFKDQVGIDSVDELRHKLGDELVSQADCPGLDYDHDIDPWLGDRMAVAAVPLAGHPRAVVVVQVKDEDKARDALAVLDRCTSDQGTAHAAFHDGWMVLAQSQETADAVVAADEKGTLADDATYQKWTKELGEAGVVNAYASPDAGRYLAKELGPLSEMLSPDAIGQESSGVVSGEAVVPDAVPSISASAFHQTAATGDDPFTEGLSGFKGGAATLRFTGGGLELAAAADGTAPKLSEVAGNTGGTLVRRLPGDTAAAVGITFPKGWLHRQLDAMSTFLGGSLTSGDMKREFSRETGLDIPDDIETLLGSGATLSIGKDFDFSAAENSDTLSGLPIGATVKGDPAAIEKVLDKIRAKAGDVAFLGSDSSDDLVAIGPTADYRQHLLDGGDLGDDATFQGVVPDAEHAASIVYVSIDALEPSIKSAVDGDQQTLENITPLRAFGLSSWTDGATVRFSIKVTTN
jgi:hypothetical protein